MMNRNLYQHEEEPYNTPVVIDSTTFGVPDIDDMAALTSVLETKNPTMASFISFSSTRTLASSQQQLSTTTTTNEGRQQGNQTFVADKVDAHDTNSLPQREQKQESRQFTLITIEANDDNSEKESSIVVASSLQSQKKRSYLADYLTQNKSNSKRSRYCWTDAWYKCDDLDGRKMIFTELYLQVKKEGRSRHLGKRQSIVPFWTWHALLGKSKRCAILYGGAVALYHLPFKQLHAPHTDRCQWSKRCRYKEEWKIESRNTLIAHIFITILLGRAPKPLKQLVWDSTSMRVPVRKRRPNIF